MNKKRFIMFSAIGVMALNVMSLSISLAWYAASDRLSVENLEINIAAKGSLKISKTGEEGSYVTDLKNEDLNELGEDFLFAPVSTMCKDTWMNDENKKATPIFYDSSDKKVLSSGEPYLEEALFGYYQTNLYLLTNLRNQYATLDFDNENIENGTYFNYDKASNIARARELYEKYPEWGLSESQILEKLNDLLKCLRISILVNEENYYRYYIVDPTRVDENDVTYLGGRLDNDRNGYFDTYKDTDKNNREVIYGEVNDRSLIKYDDPISATAPLTHVEAYNQFTANSFNPEFGSRPNAYTYNEEQSKANGFEIAKEDSLWLGALKDDNTNLLIPLTSGVPTKIVLSIYLEGWDLDCVNATMGASFISKLSFKLKGGNV